MKKTIRDNLHFLGPYLFFLGSAGAFLLMYSKADAHLLLNQYRYGFCDVFFSYATVLGDFWSVVAVVFLLCFIRYRYAMLVAFSAIVSALVTQLLKHEVFPDENRPVKFFEGTHTLNLVPGYENYSYYSFPSGHTTTAFAIFFCLALIVDNKLVKFLMFILALTVGISRVYLSQHFLNDAYAGSLIGTAFSLVSYYYFFLWEKTRNIFWLDGSLLKRKADENAPKA